MFLIILALGGERLVFLPPASLFMAYPDRKKNHENNANRLLTQRLREILKFWTKKMSFAEMA
ncbi:hypothetical protein DXT88_08910 [Herbaspirillum lusitanum]|nr:hypothetical protein [Herbaspirillum lusitanum]